MADPALHAEGLRYRYPGGGADALAGIDLRVEAGELVALAGRSASGKTTLLRAACGLVPHLHGGEVAGELRVGGLDVRDRGPAELAAAVGYVGQDPESQVVSTAVRAEIALPLELRGVPAAAVARDVEELALALAIPHLLDRAVETLSGGELQRVAIAAALAARPALLLLDEPTSQLDPVAGDELVWLLRRLNEERGVAIVLCEHRLERCLPAADRVVAMAAGAIGFDGPPPDFLAWALASEPALTTPLSQLFDSIGLRPPPVGVKRARETLAGAEGPGAKRAVAGERGAGPVRSRGTGRPSPEGGIALRARNLWVELEGNEVLRGLDLEVRRGERVALMGRNGAGKSTLLRTVAGLVGPLKGRAHAPGEVALLPQHPGDLLVRERVAEEFAEGAEAALAAVGLPGVEERDPRDLSGGERQRLALAIVMAGRGSPAGGPGLLLLDEPTRGMDRGRKEELAGLADELAASGSGVVIATHDVEFAALFASRVVLLGDGVVVADGPADEVLSGGWYFATEVARVLDVPGAITPEHGADLIGRRTDPVGRTADPLGSETGGAAP